ncbi:major facilitator superfamily domain-containing protein [Hypoxylon sp. FL0890]|nr:major facilitator superfamily domain-containing protein [Hypoxylon sp. FL0890]
MSAESSETKTQGSVKEDVDIESHPVTTSPSSHLSNPNEVSELDTDDNQWKPGSQVIMILITLSCTSFIIAVDAMILVPALPTLAGALNATSVATFWAGSSFLLAHSVFVPFIGALSDIFGRRELLLASISMFTAGTVVCCPANHIAQLLAGRTIQGVGAGGMQVLSFVIISDIIPLRQRPKYASAILLAWGIGAAVGPLIGGAIIENTTWRWIFYINFPFCALGLGVVPFTVMLKPENQKTFRQNLLRFDWLGSGLFIAGASTFLIGLTWAGVQYPWSGYQAWVPILLGGLAIVGSIFYEKYAAAMPFLRLAVFSDISAILIFLSTLIHGYLLFSHLYYLTFYYQSVREASAILAGVFVMAVNLTLFPSGILTGVLITRFGTFLWAIRSGLVIATLGNGLLLLLDRTRPIVATVFILLVHAFGQGFLLTALNVAAQAMGKTHDVAYAVTMFMFMRTFGMCLGVAVGGTVFGNVLLRALLKRNVPHAEEISQQSEAYVPLIKAMSPGPAKDAILDSYVEGFHGLFYLLIGLSGLLLVLSLFIKHQTLDKKLDSAHKLTTKFGTKGSEAVNE